MSLDTKITIKPDREYFREVCDKIENGRFAVPVFQRDFVWDKSQVIDLFDSINKGYPIGSVVLWKSTELKGAKDILTDEKISTPQPEYYILDGRQRITSFYGCISKFVEKKKIFCLGYDLVDEVFCYELDADTNHPWISIADVYDTFVLIGRLSELAKSYKGDDLQDVLYRAKNLNNTLQTYTIGEFYVDKCSLKESTEVFSRINSTGTQIDDVDMLQALSYKSDNNDLLRARIERIQSSLEDYGFGNLDPQDILYCCYQYWGLNYYESNLEELIRVLENNNENIMSKMDSVEECILATVRFLHDDCLVLDNSLLPYSRQLIALTSFFKEHSCASENQKLELKRWFYYTSATQTFLNGSLTNMRKVHKRLGAYIAGQAVTAFDYKPIELSSDFSFRFNTRAAQSDFLILAQISVYIKHTQKRVAELDYQGIYSVGHSALARFPKLSNDDKFILTNIKKKVFSKALKERYGITEEMLDNESTFLVNRESYIYAAEYQMLVDLGFDVISNKN